MFSVRFIQPAVSIGVRRNFSDGGNILEGTTFGIECMGCNESADYKICRPTTKISIF